MGYQSQVPLILISCGRWIAGHWPARHTAKLWAGSLLVVLAWGSLSRYNLDPTLSDLRLSSILSAIALGAKVEALAAEGIPTMSAGHAARRSSSHYFQPFLHWHRMHHLILLKCDSSNTPVCDASLQLLQCEAHLTSFGKSHHREID